MHLPTLFIVYAAILLACAGSLLIIWRQNPTQLGTRSWAAGAISGAVALFLFAPTGLDPELAWLNALGKVFAWLGTAFFGRGMRQHVGLTATPLWIAIGLPVAALGMFVAMAASPYPMAASTVVSSFVLAALAGDLVFAALRRPESRRAPGYFIAFFFMAFAASHAARGVLTALEMDRAVLDRPVDQAILLVGIVGAAATAMGFAMLVTARTLRERALHLQGLEAAVGDLRRQFEGLASGDYSVRARPQGPAEPMDVLALLFNETAEKVGIAFDEIEEQRSVLSATLESMVDGLLLLDAGGLVRKANPAAAALLELEQSALLGRPFQALLEESDRDFAESLLQAVSEGPLRERVVGFRAASAPLSLTVNASAHRDGSGRVQGAVLVLRDDRELRDAQARLQITDRLATMGTIAAGVAHEINNPLSYVISNVDYAVEELAEGVAGHPAAAVVDVLEALDAARRGGERVRQIVLDLKTLSRSEDEEQATGPVDVNELVESAVAMLKNEIRHHARLELALSPVPAVHANAAKLGQVFLNLIQNATQAIPSGHVSENEIRVCSGTTASGRVFVEVTDTGAGIAPDHLQRIFDAFFTTKPVGVGTGLGLAISHGVVTALGGSIEVESELGVGSCFRVVLPAALTQSKESAGEERPVQASG